MEEEKKPVSGVDEDQTHDRDYIDADNEIHDVQMNPKEGKASSFFAQPGVLAGKLTFFISIL